MEQAVEPGITGVKQQQLQVEARGVTHRPQQQGRQAGSLWGQGQWVDEKEIKEGG